MKILTIITTLLFTGIRADFDCLCNYDVETKVFSAKDTGSKPIGYLYEFDCKHRLVLADNSTAFAAIEFEHKLGFVEITDQVQVQICPGDPPLADKLITTTTSSSTKSTTTAAAESTGAVGSTLQITTEKTQITTQPTSDKSESPASSTTSESLLKPTFPKSSSPSTVPSSLSTALPPIQTSTHLQKSVSPSFQTTSVSTKRISKVAANTQSNTSSTTPVSTLGASPHLVGPFAYLGVGYDTLRAYPSTKQDGIDPGLKPQRRIFMLTNKGNTTDNVLAAEYYLYPACNITNSTEFIYDGASYQRNLLNYLSFVGNGLMDTLLRKKAFTFNNQFLNMQNETESRDKDVRVYRDVYYPCIIGEAFFKDEVANTSDLTITKEFARDVCELPTVFDLTSYTDFIDKWGTTVTMSLKMGKFSTKRYRTSGENLLYKMNGNDYMYLTGPYKGYPSSVTFNASALDSIPAVTIGTPVASWSVNRSYPVPLELDVAPLSHALDSKYWKKIIDKNIYMDVCTKPIDSIILQNIAMNIDKTLDKYAANKNPNQFLPHQHLTDIPIQIPLAWPYGTYGLMQATSGCPGSGVSWLQGSRSQDTEHTIGGNTVPQDIRQYVAGSFTSTNIVTHFCMKSQASVDGRFGHDWPSGSYCILKHHACPDGFQIGSIFWDDNNGILLFPNKNSASGVLPDGTFNQDTLIQYCCRKDESPAKSIPLPRDKPFILLRYGKTCQAVYGMETKETYILWDDEDLFNKDHVSGAHPFDDGGSRNHMLHFCHYEANQKGISPSLVG